VTVVAAKSDPYEVAANAQVLVAKQRHKDDEEWEDSMTVEPVDVSGDETYAELFALKAMKQNSIWLFDVVGNDWEQGVDPCPRVEKAVLESGIFGEAEMDIPH